MKHFHFPTGTTSLAVRLDPLLPSELVSFELGIDHPGDLLGFVQSIDFVYLPQRPSRQKRVAAATASAIGSSCSGLE